MKRTKTHNFFALVLITIMVAACGKNMSLRVNGQDSNQNQTANNVNDVAKEANKCTPVENTAAGSSAANQPKVLDAIESLQSLSEFDVTELKEKISAESISKRATFQVAPKDAINEVKALTLTLKKPHIMDATKAKICIMESECRSLTQIVVKAVESAPSKEIDLELNLLEVFELTGKSTAEITDWIYSNTTEFARPGYRKLRLSLAGIEKIEGGSLVLQLMTNEKLPLDFATKPTCYVNGDADTREPDQEEGDEEPSTSTTNSTPTNSAPVVCGVEEVNTIHGCLPQGNCPEGSGFLQETSSCIDAI